VNFAFWAVFAVIVGAALASVLLRDIVHCALALMVCFLGVAGYYVLMQAEFLAGIQVLIYVGAITVLIIFAVMLTQKSAGRAARRTNRQSGLAAGAAILTYVALVSAIHGATSSTSRPPAMWGVVSAAGPADMTRAGEVAGVGDNLRDQTATRPHSTTELIGQRFVTDYIWPFEISSIVLLVALVGAIYIARDRPAGEVESQ